MKAPAIACTVSARWEAFLPIGVDADGVRRFAWRQDSSGEQLRASLGPHRLTVWLPSGARVVCRRARIVRPGEPPQREFSHHWRDRCGDARRIVFELPADLVEGGAAMTAPAIDARLVATMVRSLTKAQASVLRDLGAGVGFAAFDLVDFHTSGSLAFRNRDRAIGALERKGLVDGEDLTDLGREVLAHHRGAK